MSAQDKIYLKQYNKVQGFTLVINISVVAGVLFMMSGVLALSEPLSDSVILYFVILIKNMYILS